MRPEKSHLWQGTALGWIQDIPEAICTSPLPLTSHLLVARVAACHRQGTEHLLARGFAAPERFSSLSPQLSGAVSQASGKQMKSSFYPTRLLFSCMCSKEASSLLDLSLQKRGISVFLLLFLDTQT